MQTIEAPTRAATDVLYEIDADDRIVSVGGDWAAFAQANGGVPDVVGRHLWDFVAGEEVRGIWELLVRHVRTQQAPLTFLYRCDAPGLRRLMQMQLSPEADGAVSFRSRVVGSFDGVTFSGGWESRSRDAVVVCGWCGRVHAGEWVTPDRAAATLGLTEPDAAWPQLSHGICGTCARQLRALVRP